ncbi:uncharacterized protein LOC123549522 [Mercenaria mercenaria]|uniref:uncharacterized protein LOC123549522 n=1 Tax=Mercenaria mercenaria TaxID=6596 RepID=UPI00234EF34F|nr:uncharacterized protein LOC123549522 [Mercenaria mercenaria]XP_045193612.2 uncharacterized protein LOC123549522 [Mercenaria mercenaria]
MDRHSSSCMFSVTVVLTTIFVCIFQISSEITFGKVKRRTNLENKPQDVRMLWQLHKSGTPVCVGECARDEKCASIFYNKITGHCQGHSITFGEPLTTSDVENYRYYVLPHGEQYIGDSCGVNDDCLTVHSECRTEICQCKPGYSFSPRTHECKVCTSYGSEYWEIIDHYISGKNMETIEDKTLQECFELCNTRTGYTCVSIEYGRTTRKCYLGNITVLDFPDRWYHDDVQTFNISYYQRDCE